LRLIWFTAEPIKISLEVPLVFQGGLRTLLESIKDKDPDKVSVGLASSLDTIAEIELLQVTETHQ
jgi:hypothetical protein